MYIPIIQTNQQNLILQKLYVIFLYDGLKVAPQTHVILVRMKIFTDIIKGMVKMRPLGPKSSESVLLRKIKEDTENVI